MSEPVEISLPVPLSVNLTRRVNWASMPARAKWLKLADGMLFTQWRGLKGKEIKGQFEVQIVLPADYRADLDNGLKAVLDYLVTQGLIPGDSPKFLRRLVVELGEHTDGCRVVLRALPNSGQVGRRLGEQGETA